jgi:hypothetical protein
MAGGAAHTFNLGDDVPHEGLCRPWTDFNRKWADHALMVCASPAVDTFTLVMTVRALTRTAAVSFASLLTHLTSPLSPHLTSLTSPHLTSLTSPHLTFFSTFSHLLSPS